MASYRPSNNKAVETQQRAGRNRQGGVASEPYLLGPLNRQTDNHPLVSVILPVYQGEDSILSAVSSVLNQTYPHLELIVVDDGSTDGTQEKLDTINSSRLKVIQQENSGVSEARNRGFRESSGEYIAFIDADDIWFPEKLETEMATIQRADDPVGITYSWYYSVNEAGQLVNFSVPFTDRGHIFETILNKDGVMLPSTATIHRQVYETIGGFEDSCYHEDRAFFIKACHQFPAYPTEQRLVIYQQVESGRCREILKDFDKACKADFSIVEALRPILSEEQAEHLKAVQTKSLFYRFLMYNFVDEAKRLYPDVDPQLMRTDRKGQLALVAMKTGINVLYQARRLAQFGMKTLLLPWWRWKTQALYETL